MELAINSLVLSIDQLEGMGAIAIHVLVPIGDATVREQERDLVGGLGTQADEVPEHVGILAHRVKVHWRMTQKVT